MSNEPELKYLLGSTTPYSACCMHLNIINMPCASNLKFIQGMKVFDYFLLIQFWTRVRLWLYIYIYTYIYICKNIYICKSGDQRANTKHPHQSFFSIFLARWQRCDANVSHCHWHRYIRMQMMMMRWWGSWWSSLLMICL